MAFLDNSGDIILDAVLTEEGRKAMSNGTFQISKFSLGDDEINYKLYDRAHPSGSAYYDLEILQTPILESTTAINANINYGLLTIANTNLLYMPVFKKNELVNNSVRTNNRIYWLASNDGKTYDALVTAFGGINGGGDKKVLRAGDRDGNAIVLEMGLDTTDITPTPANRNTYIISLGLADAGLSVSIDTRFLSTVLGPSTKDTFTTRAGSGEANVKFSLLPTTPNKNNRNIRFHSYAGVRAIANTVYYRLGDNKADTLTSVIKGPRSTAVALNFDHRTLGTNTFKRYGKTGITISGAAGTYRYIDTTVYVQSSTGIVEQLPIRIIQQE